MKTIKMIFALAPALLLLLSGCSNDLELKVPGPIDEGKVVHVPFHYTVAQEMSGDGTDIPLTRAPAEMENDGNESRIDNVFLFQFAGTGLDAPMIGSPYYIDLTQQEDAIIPLIESNGATHRFVFVANVNSAYYNWTLKAGTSTYQSLLDAYKSLISEIQSYGDGNMNLPMAATLTAVVGNTLTEVEPEFIRSVAKVKLKLAIDAVKAAGFVVKSVQLCNVSNRIDWLDALKGHSTAVDYVYPQLVQTLDYEAVTDASMLPSAGDGAFKEYRWYVPRNQQGSSANQIKSQKNTNAPIGATYFKVIAQNSQDEGVVYRIYPGANLTSDFNLLSNHIYTVSLTIEGVGNASLDSRIENFGRVDLAEGSNCYFVHPPMEGMADRIYTVPITRVNEYWQGTGAGYGNAGPNSGIGNSDNWVVDLLWQDHTDLVRGAANVLPNAIVLDKVKGTGYTNDPGRFTFRVPAGATHGNFVLALRKADGSFTPQGDILWSWHFWVTDYNPDQMIQARGDKFVYSVTNGQVERYASKLWGNSGTAEDHWENYAYIPTVTNETALAQGFIMDRYVGALSDKYVASYGRGILYYQYGRKDPFPGNIALYDINGTVLPTTSTSSFPGQYWNSTNANSISKPGGVVIPTSVNNPMQFYFSAGDWSGSGGNTDNWLDSKSPKAENQKKSIYDPCPAGWRIPDMSAFSDFRVNVTVFNSARGLQGTNGINYWPYRQVGLNYPVEGTIYYAAQGMRNWTDGKFYNAVFQCNVWSANPTSNDATYANALYMSTTSSTVTSPSSRRAQGMNVRCVKM